MEDTGANGCSIPSVHLNSEHLPSRQRFETWRWISEPVQDTALLHRDGPFEFELSVYRLDDLLITRRVCTGHTFVRGPRHRRPDGEDHLTLRLFTRGGEVCAIGDIAMVTGPGWVSLTDWRHDMRGRFPEVEGFSVLIPRARIDTRAFDRTPAVLWTTTSPSGRMLTNAVVTLWAQLSRARTEHAADLASGLVGLVDGLLSSWRIPEDGATAGSPTVDTVCRFIEGNLHDPELDAATICRTFACSRARLYRWFKPHGGVERYIGERRLERCFVGLTRADPRAVRVRTIAEKWGFDNHSHFARRFKARFAMTPSDALAFGHQDATRNGTGPQVQHDDVDVVRRWLQEL